MFLLLLGCPGDDGCAGQGRGVSCRSKTRIAPSEFFVDQDFLKRTQTSPTVGLGDVEVEQAHLVSCLDGFFGVMRRFIPVLSVGTNFVASELVREFFEHGLHLIELEVHHEQAKHRSLKSD